jgi:hypothetical protein
VSRSLENSPTLAWNVVNEELRGSVIGLDAVGDVIRVRESRTIATEFDPGNKGEICWDEDYVYVCVDTDRWKRTAIFDG